MVLLLYISPSTSYIKILLLYRHLLLARHISKERRQNTHEFRSWGGRQSKMTYIQQQLRWANIPICRRIYKQTLTVYLFFFPAAPSSIIASPSAPFDCSIGSSCPNSITYSSPTTSTDFSLSINK
jgi:hypothetical protein